MDDLMDLLVHAKGVSFPSLLQYLLFQEDLLKSACPHASAELQKQIIQKGLPDHLLQQAQAETQAKLEEITKELEILRAIPEDQYEEWAKEEYQRLDEELEDLLSSRERMVDHIQNLIRESSSWVCPEEAVDLRNQAQDALLDIQRNTRSRQQLRERFMQAHPKKTPASLMQAKRSKLMKEKMMLEAAIADTKAGFVKLQSVMAALKKSFPDVYPDLPEKP